MYYCSIPCYGFGDKISGGDSVFLLTTDKEKSFYCNGYGEVLDVYKKITPTIKFNAQTNFAPVIKKSIETLKNDKEKILYILVIIADSDVTNSKKQENIDAIIEASDYPLSIIVVGVGRNLKFLTFLFSIGDGPFGDIPKYSHIKGRKFDNVNNFFDFILNNQFTFVPYYETISNDVPNQFKNFTSAAFHKIPQQYEDIQQLKYLE